MLKGKVIDGFFPVELRRVLPPPLEVVRQEEEAGGSAAAAPVPQSVKLRFVLGEMTTDG